MQKTKVLCLILAIALASAGTAGIVMGFGGETLEPVLPDNAVNTVMDKPEEGTPVDRSAIDNLYIAQGELQRKGGFVGTTRGSTTSAGIKQEVINNRVVSHGNVFKEMITVGIVKNAYQLFMYEGNYLYRKFDSIKSANNIKWADTASKYNESDFLETFGHRSDSLTGYILNDNTIVSGTLESENNGLFQYRYVLDVTTAPARMLREMKTNSNMNGYSTYVKAEIVVVMDSDWQVKTVTTDCKYKVPMFGGVDCVEDITETFSELTSEDLPEKDFFEQFFDAEVTVPVDKAPDALSILMDMFSPYVGSGNSLNASIAVTNNGESVLNGLVSAKIDIENLENIEVAAKIGNELFVEYQGGKVYVTYQDFKASTTVDGIMGVVNSFMPKTATDDVSDSENDDILSKFTYSIENGVCVVNLPLEIGNDKLELNIYANVIENGYQFTNAVVTFGSFEVKVELANEFETPERNGKYPEILGLLDIVQNGVIYGSVNALGMNLDVTFDLSNMSLYAAGDNLSLIYRNDVIYAELGAVKAKLNVNDVDRITTLLRLAGLTDGSLALELPQISAAQIVSLLGNVTAANTENGVQISLSMDGLSVAVYLVSTDNGWTVDKAVAEFDGNVITIAMSAPTIVEVPDVDDSKYADVMELLNTFVNPVASLASANSYGVEFGFDVTVNDDVYIVAGELSIDANKNIRANATVTNSVAVLVKANVVVADGIVYLDLNGIKTAFALDETSNDVDLTKLLSGIYGINDSIDGVIETICGIVENAVNLDLSTIDFASLIDEFSFENGELKLKVNAEFLGLYGIGVKLSVDEFNCLNVRVSGLNVANLGLNLETTITANVGKVKAPNPSDYVLNLAGTIEDVAFAVSADLLNMDVWASVDAFNQTILARYVDGKVYVSAGKIAVVGAIDELGALVEYVTSLLNTDGSAIEIGEIGNIDLSLRTILDAICINLDNSLNVGLKLDGLANVTIEFDNQANFAGITADVMGYAVTIEQTLQQAEKLDVNGVYIPVEALAKHIAEIYNNYKNVLNTGLAVELNANAEIDGNVYALNATVNYHNGLYVKANIADNSNALVALDMYLVGNVVYLEVNGVRIATELPQMQADDNANVDIATILGALSQIKGYNNALDSVIATIEQLPEKLQSVDYLSLLTALTYDNGKLFVGVNGAALGLSDFELSVQGADNITLILNKLALGDVTISNLNVNVTPQCNRVTAPTSEYVTELELEVMGFNVTAKLDLLNKTVVAKTTLLGHELGVCFANNALYVSYGAVKAKLNVADIDKLLDVISSFIGGGIPAVGVPELDAKQILSSLSKVTTDNGYDFNATVAGANITLSFDGDAKLLGASVRINDVDVTAKLINGATYPSFNLNDEYVDLAVLAEAYAGEVRNVIDAQGYDVTLNGNFVFDNNVYTVKANVIYNGGLYVNADVSYNSANLLNAELWLVDNTLYVSAGDLKLAIAMSKTKNAANNGSNAIDLTAYKGYNPYVDGVIDVIQQVLDKFVGGNIDYVSLIGGLTFNNGELNLNVNGGQLGLSNLTVVLNAYNGITANVSNLAIDKMTANFTANVKASNVAVAAPQGDFTTNLSIRIDDKNTVYANLDIINGVYNFRLDDMYVMYADSVVKINKGDMYVSGNINQIMEYVKRIDDLVNEFSGAEQSTMAKIDFDMFKNVDVKAIVNSLTISSDGQKATIGLSAFGFDISAILAYGKIHTVTVPVALIDKTLQVEPCKSQTFDKFDGEHDYIQIEQVFNDYFAAFERLVHTNSWVFNFDGDAILSIGKDSYKVAAGSYFEFYYKNTEGMDTFKLRAKLDVRKQRVDGSWQPFMDIDVVYKDGNIYVTDRGRLIDGKNDADRSVLRLTVSLNTLIKCYDLYDEIVAVVPQIGELVQGIFDAMAEAEDNADNIPYSTLLGDVSYANGLFGLGLNGGALIDKLGEIVLLAQTYGEGLSLNYLELAYDTISLQVSDLRVYASKLEEKGGVTEYAAVNDINAYGFEEYHIDFNSLYELLSSFVVTATPKEGDNGARSFYITGTVIVKLSLGVPLANIKMGLSVRVDIDASNNVFISAKITRTNDKVLGIAVYDDSGGDSYLNFNSLGNGGAGSFTVIRDSKKETSGTHYEDVEELYYYCTGCQKEATKKVLSDEYQCPTQKGLFGRLHDESYIVPMFRVVNKEVPNTTLDPDNCMFEDNITTEQFTANMMDYIFEMINLNSKKSLIFGDNGIEGLIKEKISASNNTNDFGIEDVFTNYLYNESAADYQIQLNLKPIDSNLTSATLDIYHDVNYELDRLSGDLSLLNGICDINLNLTLFPTDCGLTNDIVLNNTRW